jgi:polygalacturonase
MFNVRDHGATGDGHTLDTDAINRAILAADAAGGGTVYFPAGTYLSFSVRLRSRITLHLDRGAVLLAAGDPPPGHEEILAMLTADGILPGGGAGDSGSFYAGDQFGSDDLAPAPSTPPPVRPPTSLNQALERAAKPAATAGPGYDAPEPNPHDQYQDHGHSHWHNSLIWGEDLEDVAIVGGGLIDGRGLTWNADPANPTGNKAIALKRCRNVTLRDFTIFRGGHFAVLATGCDFVTVDNVRIDSNRDGLDIDSCTHVNISNCAINTPNDDGIVLKSSYALGQPRPTEHVSISNCHLSGFDMGSFLDGTFRTTQQIAPDRGGVTGRIKFGTESNGGFRNITIANCTFTRSRGLAIESVDGGPIEDVLVTNVTMRHTTSAPLFIRLGNRARGPAGSPVAVVRRVQLTNISVADAEPRYASLFVGLAGHPIEDLLLANVTIRYRGGGGRADARLRPPEKDRAYPEPNMFGVIPAYGLFFRHVTRLRLRDVALAVDSPDKRPALFLDDVHDVSVDGLTADRFDDTPTFVLQDVSHLAVRNVPGVPDGRISTAPEQTL